MPAVVEQLVIIVVDTMLIKRELAVVQMVGLELMDIGIMMIIIGVTYMLVEAAHRLLEEPVIIMEVIIQIVLM